MPGTSLMERAAWIACHHSNLLSRQRANRILRLRYRIQRRPQPTRAPVWLSAYALG